MHPHLPILLRDAKLSAACHFTCTSLLNHPVMLYLVSQPDRKSPERSKVSHGHFCWRAMQFSIDVFHPRCWISLKRRETRGRIKVSWNLGGQRWSGHFIWRTELTVCVADPVNIIPSWIDEDEARGHFDVSSAVFCLLSPVRKLWKLVAPHGFCKRTEGVHSYRSCLILDKEY